MITLTQARTFSHGTELHVNGCRKHVGPRGGVSYFIDRWRVNGMLLEYKRIGGWRVPIKWGINVYGCVTPHNAHQFHTVDECPVYVAERA